MTGRRETDNVFLSVIRFECLSEETDCVKDARRASGYLTNRDPDNDRRFSYIPRLPNYTHVPRTATRGARVSFAAGPRGMWVALKLNAPRNCLIFTEGHAEQTNNGSFVRTNKQFGMEKISLFGNIVSGPFPLRRRVSVRLAQRRWYARDRTWPSGRMQPPGIPPRTSCAYTTENTPDTSNVGIGR